MPHLDANRSSRRASLALALVMSVSSFAVARADAPPAELLRTNYAEIAQHPADPGLWLERSHILVELRRFDEALSSIDRAAALSPDDPRIVHARADVQLTRGRTDLALAALDEHLRRWPDDRAALLRHADASELADDPRTAADDLTQALELAYDDAVALRAARLLRATGRAARASVILLAAARRTPAHPAVVLEAIEDRLRDRDTQTALSLVDTLAQGAAVPTRAELLRGRIHAMAGRRGQSLAAYRRALSLANETLRRRVSAAALVDRATARMGLADFENALVDLEAARSLSPGFEGLARLLEAARAGRSEP